ncbi:MAG: diguanylate cyclase [Acidobacteria bacterium]|nr:diguanylate cyclase [Acidobacteriota bacterium]
MNKREKYYFYTVFTLGVLGALTSVFPFVSENPLRYACFLLVAIFAAGIRLSLPDVTGTLSINFIFVLIGLIALSPSETMLLALVVTLIQCLWRPPRKATRFQVFFNLANVAISVTAMTRAYSTWSFTDLSIDAPLRLLLATFVYFIINGLNVAVAISYTEKKSIAAAWRECNLYSMPYYLIGAIAAGSFSFLKQAAGWPVLLFFVPFIYLLYRDYRLYILRLSSEKQHAEQIAGLHLRTIEALATAIEAKDQNTHDRLERMQIFAMGMGEELALSAPEMDALRAASLLHDIGKLAVPDHIIGKEGRLTREEADKLKIHPLVGAEILERANFPYPVVPMVRHHHEKWNGEGYPDGLKGEAIPIGARILAVVDAFEELTARRGNKASVPPWQAAAMVAAESGSAYDPRVAAALVHHHEKFVKRAEECNPDRLKLTLDYPATKRPVTRQQRDAAEPGSFLDSIAAARQEAQMLFEVAQELGNSLSLDETLSVFAVRLRKTIPYDSIAIYVRRDTILRPEYVSGENVRAFSNLRIAMGEGLSGRVAESRKPVMNGDPMEETGYAEQAVRPTVLQSALSIPLEGLTGVAGVLTLYGAEKEAFTTDHLRVLQVISAKVAVSIENALKYRQAESSASTDYLTGLFNARSLFLHLDSELARCRRLESPLAVLVSDLDGFKQVNDRFGHLEGNRLLQRVAQKLKESCREYDCVARMGGDEFVLVLPGLTPDAVKKMIPRLRETVKLAGKEVLQQDVIGFSVGEAYFPTDGTDAEQLLAEADRRMYLFKSKAKLLAATQAGFDFDTKLSPL